MDLFLDSRHSSTPMYYIYGVAVIGFLGIYGVYKLFGSQEDHDNEDQQDKNKPNNNKPAGIFNEGNTCFVNSLLQALSSLQSFQKLLQHTSANFRKKSITSKQQLIIELSSVLNQINKSNDSISVGKLLDTIGQIKEGLINLQQQDAHELYTAIIGCVQQILNQQKRIDLSASVKFQEENSEEEVMDNPLVGYLKSSTTCTTCNTQTAVKIDPFYDLSLDISKIHINGVKSALTQFQRQQRIDSWICSQCSIASHCRKLKKSASLLKGKNAQALCFISKDILQYLQGEDFSQCQIRQINQKLSNFVKMYSQQYEQMGDDPEKNTIFTEIEGLQSSILKRTIITKFPKILVLHMKQLVVNPYSGEPILLKKHISFDQTLAIQTKHKIKEYRLTSLLTHIGNELYGHYLSFRRANRDSDQWFVMNDSTSQKVNWESVRSSRAYMLFYESD